MLSADDLARRGISQFRDFADTVPGISFQSAGSAWNQISMRGITSGYDISPTMGLYVDEVPFGSSSAFARAAQITLDVGGMADIERIEIRRGPQGTLYGASTMGGLLKYVTKRPDASQSGVELQGGIASVGHGRTSYNGSMAANIPISQDRAALRASAYYSHEGGYVDNLKLDRKNVDAGKTYGGRVDLLLTPSDALDIRIAAFLQDIDRDGLAISEFSLDGVPVYGALAATSKGHMFRPPLLRAHAGQLTGSRSRIAVTEPGIPTESSA